MFSYLTFYQVFSVPHLITVKRGYRCSRVFFQRLVTLMLCVLIAAVSSPVQAALELTAEEQAYLDRKPYLTAYGLGTFPPFSFVSDGRLQGYTVDYLKALGELLDKEVRFTRDLVWFQAMEQLKNGQIDIIPSMAQTGQRLEHFAFTRQAPIEYSTVALFKRSQQNRPLADQVVAVTRNTFLHEYLSEHYPQLKLLVTPTSERAVQAVSFGQADIAVGSRPSLNYYLQKNWLSDLQLGLLPGLELPQKTRLPMAVAKGNTLLLSILDKAEQALPLSRVTALKQRWMDVSDSSVGVQGLSSEEVQFLRHQKQFTVCVDPNWMPFEGVEDGQHIGLSADMLALFARRLEVRFERLPTQTWSESLQAGAAGRCDLFPLIMPLESRAVFLNFSQPVLTSSLVLVTDVTQPYIQDAGKLSGKTIGIGEGFGFFSLLEKRYPDLTFVTVANISDGLEKVRSGELFGYVDSLTGTGYWLQNRYNGQLKVSAEFDERWQLTVGVRRNLQPLLGVINKTIDQTRETELEALLQKWTAIRYRHTTNWWITVLGVLLTVVILGSVLAWYMRLNQRLKSEVKRRIQAEKAALELAHTDQLTGLLNRHGCDELIRQAIARKQRHGTAVSLIILDIDHFKRINDEFGHKVGDDVLKALAKALGPLLRETDYLVRWGGEEFLVLLPDTGLDAAARVAEKLRVALAAMRAPGLPAITISLGVAELNSDEAFNSWYQRTDQALYRAKESGRNRVQRAEAGVGA